MSNSIIDSIQATETGQAFWEHFNQSPTAVDQLIRDLVEVDADYTIPLPAQHAMTGEVLHRVGSVGDVFGHEDRQPYQQQ